MKSVALFVILLATLAVSSFGAPVEKDSWPHHCGHATLSNSDTKGHRKRQDVKGSLRTVKHQLAIAKDHYKKLEPNLTEFYKEVKAPNFTYSYEWLRQEKLDGYLESKCSRGNITKVKTGLKDFYGYLQIFYATFEELEKISPNELDLLSKGNITIRRNNTQAMLVYLELVLCEVQTSLFHLKVPIPEPVSATFVSNQTDWDKNPDTTGVLYRDWGIIQEYDKFLENWTVVLRSLNKKTDCKSLGVGKEKKKRKTKPRKGNKP